MNPQGNAAVISVDRHHPDMVFAANWFCTYYYCYYYYYYSYYSYYYYY